MYQSDKDTGESAPSPISKRFSKAIFALLFFLFLAIFISSSYILSNNMKRNKGHQQELQSLTQYVHAPKQAADNAAAGEDSAKLDGLRQLSGLNPDFTGWLSIAGTDFEYPVMQNRHNPDFYLNHSFSGTESPYGVPYIDAKCIASSPYANVLIYGHNMKDGAVFGILRSFEQEAFWQEHKTIQFDSLSSLGTYDILAVFKTTIEDGGFAYYDYVGGNNSDAFYNYVTQCAALSLYPTGVAPVFGRQLLTLSTCDTYDDAGRIVLVAQKR